MQSMSLRVDSGMSSSLLQKKELEGDFALVSKGITISYSIAFLNKNEDKIVIVLNIWTNEGKINKPED